MKQTFTYHKPLYWWKIQEDIIYKGFKRWCKISLAGYAINMRANDVGVWQSDTVQAQAREPNISDALSGFPGEVASVSYKLLQGIKRALNKLEQRTICVTDKSSSWISKAQQYKCTSRRRNINHQPGQHFDGASMILEKLISITNVENASLVAEW